MKMVKNCKSIIKSIVYVLAGVLFSPCIAFSMDKTSHKFSFRVSHQEL